MALAEIFRALGDPVRLEMVQRLSNGEPCTISTVSADLGVTRQGARKHLQALVDANIVTLEPKGRDVIVRLDRGALDEARTYIAHLERQWDQRLDALRRFVEDDDDGQNAVKRGSRLSLNSSEDQTGVDPAEAEGV